MSESTARAYDLYQLGEATHTSHWTLRKHVKLGTIRVIRLGNRIRVTQDEVERILREGLPSLKATNWAEPAPPQTEAAA
jgi:hypothetical protein